MAQEIKDSHQRFPDSVTVQVRRDGPTVFVRLAGQLDLAAEAPLEQVLSELVAQSGVKSLITDLRRITSLDSSGLRLLLKIEMQSRDDGFDFAVIPPHGQAMQAIRGSRVGKLIKMRDSDGARAAERASAGLGTRQDDPGDWLYSPGKSARDQQKDTAAEIY
jgi:anti-anti-sigma factor